MSDLLREVDEDVAKEKSEQFLEKWGLSIGVFLVILIGGLFFYFDWQSRSQATALDAANSFAQSTELLIGEPEAATALLTDLSLSNSGFAHLAKFKAGDSLWTAGEEAAAVAAWQAYINDPDANAELANTTRFKLAWFGNPYLESADILSMIDVLEAEAAYASYAPILRAVHAVSNGDIDTAQALLDAASAGDSGEGDTGEDDASDTETPDLARDLADAVGSLVRSL